MEAFVLTLPPHHQTICDWACKNQYWESKLQPLQPSYKLINIFSSGKSNEQEIKFILLLHCCTHTLSYHTDKKAIFG